MNSPRMTFTMSMLLDGRVLVTGGFALNVKTSVNTAEIYDPITGNWIRIKSMHEARFLHTATVLQSGQVMVVGGIENMNEAANTYELYDLQTGYWTLFEMPVKYAAHQAMLLPNGKLLIVGGSCEDCEHGQNMLFDTNTRKWTRTGSLPDGLWRFTLTLLKNGNVLVTGGSYSLTGGINDTFLYNPLTGKMKRTGYLKQSRSWHRASLLPSGKVLVTGGETDDEFTINSTELYDPSTGEWTFSDSMKYDRESHTETVLPNGDVIISGGSSDIGGYSEQIVELYDSSTEMFTSSFHNK